MVDGVLYGLLILLAGLASFTDLTAGKIYNRHLLAFLLAGLGLNSLAAVLGLAGRNPAYLAALLQNAAFALALACLLYAARLWTAGDAKLFAVCVALLPLESFGPGRASLFPGLTTLMNTFALALAYVLADTALHLLQEARGRLKRPPAARLALPPARSLLAPLLALLLLAGLYHHLLANLWPQVYQRNPGLFQVIYFALALLVLRALSPGSHLALAAGLALALATLHLAWRPLAVSSVSAASPSIALLVGALLVLRFVSGRYDFTAIPAAELKPGMALAPLALAWLNAHRALDPPARAGDRLTAGQAVAVSAWCAANAPGQPLPVARRVPFACFIALGALAQALLQGYILA